MSLRVIPASNNAQQGPDLHTLRRVWLCAEYGLFAVGVVLLAIYAAVRIDGFLRSRAELRVFEALDGSKPSGASQVNFHLWSKSRIEAYNASLTSQLGAPLGVLAIPRIGLEAPVLDGTDGLTLNRGVGHIGGTARPGQSGNIGIAGHRDGFFRGLKDVAIGDSVELRTLKGTTVYRIDRIQIVGPEDVYVLRPRPVSSVTLVTCYPFYFIGSAPRRYIVSATFVKERRAPAVGASQVSLDQSSGSKRRGDE